MVTIHAAHGLRIVIFLDDQAPAPVHIFGDGQMKVDVADPCGPRLVWAEDMKHGDIRRALAIVTEKRDHFIMRWNEIHG